MKNGWLTYILWKQIGQDDDVCFVKEKNWDGEVGIPEMGATKQAQEERHISKTPKYFG